MEVLLQTQGPTMLSTPHHLPFLNAPVLFAVAGEGADLDTPRPGHPVLTNASAILFANLACWTHLPSLTLTAAAGRGPIQAC